SRSRCHAVDSRPDSDENACLSRANSSGGMPSTPAIKYGVSTGTRASTASASFDGLPGAEASCLSGSPSAAPPPTPSLLQATNEPTRTTAARLRVYRLVMNTPDNASLPDAGALLVSAFHYRSG